MSYCRWSDSDVYIYDSCEGGVRFFVGGGFDKSFDRLCGTYNEAYQYARRLRDEHGLNVPDYAIEALKEDALEEVARWTGPGSVVADLMVENAKLRELVKDLYDVAEFSIGYFGDTYDIRKRMDALGIEVDE